jgi:hypothetical protein
LKALFYNAGTSPANPFKKLAALCNNQWVLSLLHSEKPMFRRIVRCLVCLCAEGVGSVAMAGSFVCCWVTFATNDYRPILAMGMGLWLLASACLVVLLCLRWATVLHLILWALMSLLVWVELLPRGLALLAQP